MPTIRLVPQQRRTVRLVPMGGGSDGNDVRIRRLVKEGKLISPLARHYKEPLKLTYRGKSPTFVDKRLKAQAPTTARMKKSEIMNLIKKHFPKNEWENAYKVVLGESGGDPIKVGDQYDIRGEYRPSHGLFQIREFENRPSPEKLKKPETNVKFAAKLWKDQGWNPWSVAREIGLVEGYETVPGTVQRIKDTVKMIGEL